MTVEGGKDVVSNVTAGVTTDVSLAHPAVDSLALAAGSRVMVDSFEGFGGPGVIVEQRDDPYSKFRVAMDGASQPPFWCHDFELSPLLEPVRYDSRPDTWDHILKVRNLLEKVVLNLRRRQEVHDASKLLSPEVEMFDEYTPKLRAMTYGSEEYKACLKELGKALEHHYANNSHHPEHYPVPNNEYTSQLSRDIWDLGSVSSVLGMTNEAWLDLRCRIEKVMLASLKAAESRVNGMSLLDIIEMLVDWKAATLRHADGNLRKSIEINQARFSYSDELKQILTNTAERLGLFL